MSWVFFAGIGYFFNALAALGDKIILGTVLPRPVSYAFWQGMLSLGVLVFVPFGFSLLGPEEILISFLAGALSVWALFLFFEALSRKEATKVLPIVFSLIPLFLFALEASFLETQFQSKEITAASLLIGGSVALSWESKKEKAVSFRRFLGPSLAAAFFFASSLFLMKRLFLHEGFVTVLVWSRFGLFLGGLSFLLFPSWRKEIVSSLAHVRRPAGGLPIVGVKLLGALGALSIFLAISRGPAALVQSLQGLEYAFIFIFALMISSLAPGLLRESFTPKTLLQKLGGMALVSLGVFFLF